METSAPPAIGPDGLRELAQRPPTPAFSPIGGRAAVIVQVKRGKLKPKDRAAVLQWLRDVPCPTIAIGSTGADPAITEGCAVVRDDAKKAAALAANAARNPLTVSVLVQLLRVTGALPVDD